MKTSNLFLMLLLLVFSSCSIGNIVNKSLEKNKIYSDEINYEVNMIKEGKEVKIIPLRHLGTPQFYENLKVALAKYQNQGYVIFYERIKSNNATEDDRRKYRKILPIKINLSDNKQVDYKEILLEKIRKVDSKFEFTKNIVPQPSYDFLIADLNNSKNVDVNISQFVGEYERLYGAIVLDSCDYITDWKETTCTAKRAKNIDKVTLDFRNNNVVNTVLSATNDKILILYGENHIKGFKKLLQQQGYKLEE
jgi:hypothetical protein